MKNKAYWEKRYAQMIETGQSGTMTLRKDATNQQFEDELVKLIPARKAKKVLDFGCGAGKKMDACFRLFDLDKYIGYDEVESIVKWCKKNVKRKKAKFEVKLTEKVFDAIFSAMVIQHMDDAEAVKTLNMFHVKLRKGGRAIVCALVLAGNDTDTQIYRDDKAYDELFAKTKLKGKKLGNMTIQGYPIGVWEFTK